MFCKHCGSDTGSSPFCVNCGARMSADDVGKEPPTSPEVPGVSETPTSGAQIPPPPGFQPPPPTGVQPPPPSGYQAPPPGGYYQQSNIGQPFQQPYQQPPQQPVVEDKLGCGWMLLIFLVPIVGIILYALWHKDRPQAAKSALIEFIVMMALSVVGGIIGGIMYAAVIGSTVSGYYAILPFIGL